MTEAAPSASVLIVEDEPDFREMLAFQFSMKGYETYSASDGAEALDFVWTHHVSAVVTDIRMPGMDGVELVNRIKSVDVHKPAVILVSAYPDLAPEDAYDEGAEGLFTKPFRLADIVEIVHRLAVPLAERVKDACAGPPIHEMALTLQSLEDGRLAGLFDLGRGGMHIATQGVAPLPGHCVAFDVSMEEGPLEAIRGVGTVRWIRPEGSSTLPPACGIEFDYLDGEVLVPVTQWLANTQLRPYIPSLYCSH